MSRGGSVPTSVSNSGGSSSSSGGSMLKVYTDITARDADKNNLDDSQLVLVNDASGDSRIASGRAVYVWFKSSSIFWLMSHDASVDTDKFLLKKNFIFSGLFDGGNYTNFDALPSISTLTADDKKKLYTVLNPQGIVGTANRRGAGVYRVVTLADNSEVWKHIGRINEVLKALVDYLRKDDFVSVANINSKSDNKEYIRAKELWDSIFGKNIPTDAEKTAIGNLPTDTKDDLSKKVSALDKFDIRVYNNETSSAKTFKLDVNENYYFDMGADLTVAGSGVVELPTTNLNNGDKVRCRFHLMRDNNDIVWNFKGNIEGTNYDGSGSPKYYVVSKALLYEDKTYDFVWDATNSTWDVILVLNPRNFYLALDSSEYSGIKSKTDNLPSDTNAELAKKLEISSVEPLFLINDTSGQKDHKDLKLGRTYILNVTTSAGSDDIFELPKSPVNNDWFIIYFNEEGGYFFRGVGHIGGSSFTSASPYVFGMNFWGKAYKFVYDGSTWNMNVIEPNLVFSHVIFKSLLINTTSANTALLNQLYESDASISNGSTFSLMADSNTLKGFYLVHKNRAGKVSSERLLPVFEGFTVMIDRDNIIYRYSSSQRQLKELVHPFTTPHRDLYQTVFYSVENVNSTSSTNSELQTFANLSNGETKYYAVSRSSMDGIFKVARSNAGTYTVTKEYEFVNGMLFLANADKKTYQYDMVNRNFTEFLQAFDKTEKDKLNTVPVNPLGQGDITDSYSQNSGALVLSQKGAKTLYDTFYKVASHLGEPDYSAYFRVLNSDGNITELLGKNPYTNYWQTGLLSNWTNGNKLWADHLNFDYTDGNTTCEFYFYFDENDIDDVSVANNILTFKKGATSKFELAVSTVTSGVSSSNLNVKYFTKSTYEQTVIIRAVFVVPLASGDNDRKVSFEMQNINGFTPTKDNMTISMRQMEGNTLNPTSYNLHGRVAVTVASGNVAIVTDFSSVDDLKVPSSKAVKTALDGKADKFNLVSDISNYDPTLLDELISAKVAEQLLLKQGLQYTHFFSDAERVFLNDGQTKTLNDLTFKIKFPFTIDITVQYAVMVTSDENFMTGNALFFIYRKVGANSRVLLPLTTSTQAGVNVHGAGSPAPGAGANPKEANNMSFAKGYTTINANEETELSLDVKAVDTNMCCVFSASTSSLYGAKTVPYVTITSNVKNSLMTFTV